MTQQAQLFTAPFAVFEGHDGVGKTAVMERVVEILDHDGVDMVVTREPGGTEVGEELRKILKLNRPEGQKLEKVTEILLHQAYRREHMSKVVKPALQAGQLVLSDRFMQSTLAFNVLPFLTDEDDSLGHLFMATSQFVIHDVPQPIVYLFLMPEEARKARIAARPKKEGAVEDNYETRDDKYQATVAEAYMKLQYSDGVIVIDAQRPLEDIAQEIAAHLKAQIAQIKADTEAFTKQLEVADDKLEAAVLETEAESPEELKLPAAFNLENEVEAFLVREVTSALFNGDEAPVADAFAPARALILSLYKASGDDADIFVGSGLQLLRQRVHSILHYGHQLKLLEAKVAVDSKVDGE